MYVYGYTSFNPLESTFEGDAGFAVDVDAAYGWNDQTSGADITSGPRYVGLSRSFPSSFLFFDTCSISTRPAESTGY